MYSGIALFALCAALRDVVATGADTALGLLTPAGVELAGAQCSCLSFTIASVPVEYDSDIPDLRYRAAPGLVVGVLERHAIAVLSGPTINEPADICL
jgi:hypothetical protein